MEGNYQPGFYNTESGQQPQQQQQAAHYPVELPLPYHTTSQHQSEFVADQPLRTFPISHPVGPVLRSIYESAPMLPSSNLVQQVHQQPAFPLRGHRGKSSSNHAPSITTLEPVRSNLHGETLTPEPASMTAHSTERRKQCPTSKQQSSSNNSKSSMVISSSQKLPRGLTFKMTSDGKVDGVVAKETIEKGVEFGPMTGTLMTEDEGWSKETSWEICMPGGISFYIDGCKDWMSHLRCAQTEEEQNMEAFQCYGDIFFRSTQVIEPGSELRVFYSKKYKRRAGIEARLQDLRFNLDAQKFQCSLCEGLFSSSKLILRHIRCEHTMNRPDDMIPVLMWKNQKKKSAEPNVIAKQPPTKETKTKDTEELVFKCGTCEKVFPSRGRLIAHEMFHDDGKEFPCPVCGKICVNASTLGRHMMKHELTGSETLFECKRCDQKLRTKSALYEHEKKVHGYKCSMCSEEFSGKRALLKHEQTHRRQPSEPSADEPIDMLGKSSKYYSEQRPFKCSFCPKRFVKRIKADDHEKEAHTLEGSFKCTICPKVFTNQCRLDRHIQVHKQNRMYRCTLCPRTFASESALNNHQDEHTGLKPYKCDVCGLGFRVKKYVSVHRRRVHGDRQMLMRFFCSFCNKGFCKNGELLRHERRHKGIRPYVCLECGKAFTSSCTLTAHKKSLHVAEKPFSCEICGKKFALNQHYTYHMFKHKTEGDTNQSNGIQQ